MSRNIADLWKNEYKQKGIPSSYLEGPSQCVLWFEEYIRQHSLKKGSALDIGCGRGRNAFYLSRSGFRVSCLDLVEENIANIQSAAKEIDAKCHDLTKPFPYSNGHFDYAVDVFCFKHLAEEEARNHYLWELKRVLKKGGVYLLSLASVEDGFYGPLLGQSPNPAQRLVIDPYSNIPSILYRREDVEKFFKGFNLLEFSEKRSIGQMHTKQYIRCVLSFLFESE
jgi:SAM-dependent methyltransferase